MIGSLRIALLLAGGLALVRPAPAAAQVAVDLRVSWESDRGHVHRDGGHPDRWAEHPRKKKHRRGDPHRDDRVHARIVVRVPPGHLPPPGLCRLWFPGRPPGHQPRPQRCERVFRQAYAYPEAVVLGAAHADWEDHDRGWERPSDRARGRR